MQLLGVHPCKTLLRPGEAVRGANDAAATAQVDIEAVLAWRDTMVSNDSHAGRQRWLAEHGIDLVGGRAQLAGTGVVDVDGVRHTAEHVVVATGSEPIIPPDYRPVHLRPLTNEVSTIPPRERVY